MEDLEEKILMEVFDDGTLEEYDFSDVEDEYATCNTCGKSEIPENPEEENYVRTGIYNCNICKEEIKLGGYFKNLNSKGILKDYADWIIKLYPEFRKYF